MSLTRLALLPDLISTYQTCYPNPKEEVLVEAEKIELEFIQEDLPKVLSSLRVGSERIHQIVLALRIFSRLDEAEVKAVDITEGLESTLMLLRHRLAAHSNQPAIQITKHYDEMPEIECRPGLLNQAFMNILANAVDALSEYSSQSRKKLDAAWSPEIVIRTAVLDEKWVQIAIADNGPGMTKHIQQRIFEPFFTTKPVGKGTGMGMSITYQIIKQRHHGLLECHSELGKGTEFLIQVPIKFVAQS